MAITNIQPGDTIAIRWKSDACRSEAVSCFEVTATFGDVVMGARHRELPAEGVQFHPESVLTPQGKHLLANFLED